MKRRDFIERTATVSALTAASIAFPYRLFAQPRSEVVVITGSGSGFGKQMALTFARSVYRVLATMRDIVGRKQAAAEELRQTARREGLLLFVEQLDVTNDNECRDVISRIWSTTGRIDIFVNNAGVLVYTPTEIAPAALWQYQMNTNLHGPMNLVGFVQPLMRQSNKGLFIQISSRVGRAIIPGLGLYCTSKMAFESASEALYYEATPQNIDVAIIQLSAYASDINRNAGRIYNQITRPLLSQLRPTSAQYYEDFLNKLERDFSGNPQRNPQEVADLALNIARTPSQNRFLRYTVGDESELDAVDEINRFLSDKREAVLSDSGYRELYRK